MPDELLIALRHIPHSVRLAPTPGTFARRLWDRLSRKPEPRWVITTTAWPEPPRGFDTTFEAELRQLIEAVRVPAGLFEPVRGESGYRAIISSDTSKGARLIIIDEADELQGKSLSVGGLEINASENFPRDENAKGGAAE